MLRTMAERQQSKSQDAYKRSRSPEGLVLTYPAFRLFEVFHLENFEQLYKGLIKLLPTLIDHRQSFSSDFHNQSQTLSGTSWQRLGYLVRDEVPLLVRFDVHSRISNLPTEVWLIEVELHRLLPSIYAVTFDVHLKTSATEHLTALHNRRYLPALRFRGLLPFKRLGGTLHISGHSWSNPEDEMSSKLLEWSESLRDGVERCCIRPFLNGYFTKQATVKHARLPAVEAYILSGAPEDREVFVKWAEDARFWLDPLGFSRPYDTYSNDVFSFSWSNKQPGVGTWPHRLVVMRQALLKSVDLEDYGNDEDAALMNNMKDTLNGLTGAIVLSEYLQSIQKKIEKIRTAALGSMNSSGGLKAYLDKSSDIQRESHLLDRLSLEVTQEKPLLETMSESESLFSNYSGDKSQTLQEAFLESLDARIAFLKTQLSYVNDAFSEFLALRNMKVNYKLQQYVFWLTLIATFAAIMSVVSSWTAIKQVLKELSSMLFPNSGL
ncbi:MAG: hypothetical protein LC794_06395 [Acidobacteria bacterium]|nr:hypothetical protein [Acidobacteriota bacterium]